MSETPTNIQAPSYNDLYYLVEDLRERIRQLESVTPATLGDVAEQRAAVPVDYRILPDVTSATEVFTGNEPNITAKDWLDNVDGIANVNAWPFRYRLQYVRKHVAGAARSWFNAYEFENWADFVNKFRLVFVREVRISDRWRELEGRTQNNGEPTVDYFFAKLTLCKALQLPISDSREHILEGLANQQQADWTATQRHITENDLLADLREWERRRARRNSIFSTTPKSNTNTNATKPNSNAPNLSNMFVPRQNLHAPKPNAVGQRFGRQPETTATNVNSAMTGMSSGARAGKLGAHVQSTVWCYNCRGRGHISRDCQQPRRPMRCTICGSDRHRMGQSTAVPGE